MGHFPQLTADQLDLAVDTFDFEQSLSDTLGDLGTPADGFDSYVNDTIFLLAAMGDPSSSLVDDLTLAASIGSSIDPLSLQGDATSLPASLAAGDSVLSDANALLGSVGAVPPTGGGSGGGSGGAPTPACIDVNFGQVTGFSQALSRNVIYTNPLAVTVTIKSVTLSPAEYAQIAGILPSLVGKVLAPGASVTFAVQMIAVPGTYKGSFTLNTDAPDPQPCITFELIATDPAAGGGVQPPGGILTGGGQPPRTGRNG